MCTSLLVLSAVLGAPNVAVMVHGAGGGGWEYNKWRPAFERGGWEVIAKDLMPVDEGLDKTTFGDYVEQVVSWLPAGRPNRVVLIGASMGGVLVWKAAERIRPDAIVLVNSSVPFGIGPPREPKDYPSIIVWKDGPMEDTRKALFDSDEETIQWAHRKWRNESGAVLAEIRKGVKVEKPRCPVLVIVSERDDTIPLNYGIEMAKEYGGDLVFYHGMSHVGPLLSTRAEEVARGVVAWLKERLGR